MSSEKENQEPEKGAPDSKGVAELFLQSVGLTDVILGALAIYLVRLWYGPQISDLFPSTGQQWIDFGLLAAGAAFSGKVILLLAYFIAAVIEGLIEKFQLLDASTTLIEILQQYRRARGHTVDIGKWEKVDLAVAYVAKASPRLLGELERIRNTSLMAYSAVLLAAPFTAYLFSRGAGWRVVGILIICVIALFVLAFVNQLDYLVTLRNSIAVLLPTRRPRAGSLEGETVEIRISSTETLTVNNAARFLSSLALMRTALSLDSDAEAERTLMHIRDLGFLSQNIDAELYELGEAVLKMDEFLTPKPLLSSLISQKLIGLPPASGLELISLTQGSAIGVIKEGIKRIRKRLQRSLSAASGLLPKKDPTAFKEGVKDLVRETDLSPALRPYVAGLLVISGSLLLEALTDMKAEKIELVADADEEESQRTSASW